MSEQKSAPARPENPARLPGEADLQMSVKSMKAFAHPLRMAMYTYLNDHGSATATMLAEQLGESTGQTSYHLRQLEKQGLVTDDPDHGSGRERWWKPVGFSLRQELLAEAGTDAPALQTLVQHQLQERMMRLREWLTTMESQPREWMNAAVDSTATTMMTAQEAQAMVKELMAVIDRHTEDARQRAEEHGATSAEKRVRVYVSAFPLPD